MGRSLAILAIGLVAAFLALQLAGGGGGSVEAASACPTNPPLPSAKAPCYLVNSTGDLVDASHVDPKCEAAPIGSNKCSLRAAIEQANYQGKTGSAGAGGCTIANPCTIKFDPVVFPDGPPIGPAVIQIDNPDSGSNGLLPPIEVPLTIDNTGTGVVIEPHLEANGSTGFLDYGLYVLDDTPSNGTSFTLIGDKNFTVRGFIDGNIGVDGNGDGILVCGHSVQDAFDFRGATRYDPTADDCDELGPINGFTVTGTTVALKGSDGIQIDSDGAQNLLIDNVDIFAVGSDASGGSDGNAIEIEAGANSPVTGSISNSTLWANDDAIEITGNKCHMNVVDNGDITGLDDAIEFNCGDGSRVHVERNGRILGGSGEGVDIEMGDGSHAFVNDNGDIFGGEDGQAVDVTSGISLILEVIGNGHIEGGDTGVEVSASDGADITINDNSPAGTIHSFTEEAIQLTGLGDGSNVEIVNNGNITAKDDEEAIEIEATDNLTVLINQNGDITGGNDSIYVTAGDAVEVDITDNGHITDRNGGYGVDFSVGDDFIGLVDGNGNITGGEDGIDLSCSDGATLTVTNNLDIIGFDGGYGVYVSCGDDTTVTIEDNGVSVAGAAGQSVGPGNITGYSYGVYVSTGDDTSVNVNRNGSIIGYTDTGIYVSSGDNTDLTATFNASIIGYSYGTYMSTGETTTAVITDNGNIEGWNDTGLYFSTSSVVDATIERNGLEGTIEGGSYGIYFSSSDDVTASIVDNGDITGFDTYAIYCSCSSQIDFTITDNADITGGEYGIYCSCSDDITFNVTGNDDITGYSTTALYCSCGDNVLWDVVDNGDIVGGEYGIYCSCSSNIEYNVLDNGEIEGWDYYGIYCSCSDDVEWTVLRNGSNSIKGGEYGIYFSAGDDVSLEAAENGDIIGYYYYAIYMSTSDRLELNVHDNGNITGGEYGVYVSSGDDLNIDLINNGNIVGNYYSAIYCSCGDNIEADIVNNGAPPGVYNVAGANIGQYPSGSIIGGDDGIEFSCGLNLELTVTGQGDIVGVDDDGFEIDCGDNGDILIQNNLDIWGGSSDEAIDIDLGLGNEIDILGNGEIDGGEDGIDIVAGGSTNINIEDNSPAGTIKGGEGDGIDVEIGSDSTIDVINNGPISGGDGNDGIDIDGFNSIIATIEENGHISGRDSGIELDGTTLFFYIRNNAGIHGFEEDGIQIQDSGVGVSPPDLDIVEGEIISNGVIWGGNNDDGIVITAVNAAGDPNARLQNVLIQDNTIGNKTSGSGNHGIFLDCRQTANDCIGFANVITDNVIQGNGEEGIVLLGDDGINFNNNTVGPDNTITQNGGPGVHIIDASDNLIIENSIGYNGNITSGIDIEESLAEADGNTITRNSIWNNVGLGIDLAQDGIGCPLGGNDPNTGPQWSCDDIPPAPGVSGNTISGRVGPPNGVPLCAFCTVEAFIADNPNDPKGHGEGAHFLGTGLTDGTGNYIIAVDKNAVCGGKAGSVTITVTDTDGSTSEFSRNTAGYAGTNPCAPTPTPTNTPAPTNTPGPTSTPGPSPTTGPTSTSVPPTSTPDDEKICGDVNMDGIVTAVDAQLLLQFKAGLIQSIPNEISADVDGNGDIQSLDALLILQLTAGLIDESDLNCIGI
jgi:CSLREA domain-containing protein